MCGHTHVPQLVDLRHILPNMAGNDTLFMDSDGHHGNKALLAKVHGDRLSNAP